MRYWIMVLTIFLAACQQVPVAESKPKAPSLNVWTMSGKFSFYHHETVLGSFDWERDEAQYLMRFRGPLSVGTAVLKGRSGAVEFSNDRGDRAVDTSAESLLRTHMGWDVPMEGLHYWVQGLLVPGEAARVAKDDYGRYQVIEQLGWRTEISDYKIMHGVMVPTRFLFKRGDVWGKMVIKSWDWQEGV